MKLKVIILFLVFAQQLFSLSSLNSVVSTRYTYKLVSDDDTTPFPSHLSDTYFIKTPDFDYLMVSNFGLARIKDLNYTESPNIVCKHIPNPRFTYGQYSHKHNLFYLNSIDVINSYNYETNQQVASQKIFLMMSVNPVILTANNIEYYLVLAINTVNENEVQKLTTQYFVTSANTQIDLIDTTLSTDQPFSAVVNAPPSPNLPSSLAYAFYTNRSTVSTTIYTIQVNLKGSWDKRWLTIKNFVGNNMAFDNGLLVLYGTDAVNDNQEAAQLPVKVIVINTNATKTGDVIYCGHSDSNTDISVEPNQGAIGDFFRWTEFPLSVSSNHNSLGPAAVDLVNNQIFLSYTNINQFSFVHRINLHNLKAEIPYMLTNTMSALSKNLLIQYVNVSQANPPSKSNDANEMVPLQTVLYACSYVGSVLEYYVPPPCPNNCSAHGTCMFGECKCDESYYDLDCGKKTCKSPCLNGGTCSNSGICICQSDWTGLDCSERRCPDNCNSQGVCSGSPDYVCACNPKYGGPSCAVLASKMCNLFNSTECVTKIGYCGYCKESDTCMTGGYDGPTVGSCPSWYVGTNFQVAIMIGAIILIIIWSLMFLNNMVASMSMDYATSMVLSNSEKLLTAAFLKEYYWRDERSSKFWKLTDQLQFISSYVILSVPFPSELVQFCSYLNWSNFFLPYPYKYRDTTTEYPNRVVSSVDQYFNSVGVNTSAVFYGTLFWFGCFLAGTCVLYAVYGLIMWLMLKDREPKISTVIVSKFYYVLTRIVLWGIYPLVLASAWHMRAGYGDSKPTIAAAVIIIILFGLLPIAFNAFVVWGKGKTLLLLYLKLRFGPLYSIYHYKKAFFNCIVMARKVLFAFFLGILAYRGSDSSIYAQVIVLIIIWVIYAFIVLLMRPYLDVLHLILDLIVSILSAVALGASITHSQSPSVVGEIIAAVCVVLQVVTCIIAYIHSWTNIEGTNTYPTIFIRHALDGESAAPDSSVKMTEGQRERAERSRKGDVSGALPQTKKRIETEDSDLESSLQSS